jgi:hypothetical protein
MIEEKETQSANIADFVTKKVILSSDSYKKAKIAIEVLSIEGKEAQAINTVINKAIASFFKNEVLPEVSGL